MREVHERSNLVDVYRTTSQGIADLRCAKTQIFYRLFYALHTSAHCFTSPPPPPRSRLLLLLLHRSARCLDLDREIESTSSRIRALAEQRRNGVALLDEDNEGFWGIKKDGKKIWISHAEQKKLEL
jgi:hypothetical protein